MLALLFNINVINSSACGFVELYFKFIIYIMNVMSEIQIILLNVNEFHCGKSENFADVY